jgi:Ca2+-transporting ATPase
MNAIDAESEIVHLATLPPDEALRALGSRPEGLHGDEAAGRLATDGPNRIPEPEGPSRIARLVAQLTHFFALLLWAAAILAFVGGMPALGVAIVVVVIVNGVFSFAQEERAEHATAALRQLLPVEATVLRDGRRAPIAATELVRGDVVLLVEGDRISADARVLQADALRVDESTLTGESVPVSRTTEPWTEPQDDPIAAPGLVFAGTYVTSGAARAAVAATGARTRLGQIARLTGEVRRRPTPLRLDLDRAVRVIASFAIGAGVVFFAVSLGLGTPARDGFLFAIGVIVALVPEGLLPTLTLSLAMSATRMAHRGALVRHLESVETLGATTSICSDKTGTMTTNQMTAREARTPSRSLTATNAGWAPGGTLLESERPLDAPALAEIDPLLRAAALCGDARLEQFHGLWRCVGDPTEGALLAFAHKGGVHREEAERFMPRVREFPFGSERRRMTTIHRRADGTLVGYTKGSPETVLGECTAILAGDRREPLDDVLRARVQADIEALAGRGLRVLGFATREHGGTMPVDADAAEFDLVFLGLVGMEDPVRPEVPGAIRRCVHAGIRVVMVTGDHPATARSVARAVGLPGQDVVLGADLPADDGPLRELLADPGLGVLARIAPEQKLRIARALQANNEVVAMTGDGVNDAPALRQSDIGVAMGITGTDVAREAADLVLLDDNFAHIVEAIEEGRAAFANIRRFLTYHLTDNVAELAPFLLWALSGGRIPLLISVLQVLALDIGTDLLPALALGAERPEPGVMDRPPRAKTQRLLDRHVLARAFAWLGPIEAVCSLLMAPVGAALFFGWSPWQGLPDSGAEKMTLSAMVFAAIVLMQMANAFACRSDPASLRRIGPFTNRLLVGAVGVEAVTLLAFIYVPGLRHALGGAPLTWQQWLPVLVTPWVLLALEETRKAIVRARHRARGARVLATPDASRWVHLQETRSR